MQSLNYIKKINWKYIVLFVILFVIILALMNWLFIPILLSNNIPSENEPFEVQEGDVLKGQIVLYYTSWCGYSRQFLPVWDEFGKYAKTNFPNLRVTRVRCESDNEALCQQKNIPGYPTVIIYPKNESEVVFDGPRNKEALIKFVKQNIKF